MNLNKKELKIVSYEFRCVANRLLSAHYDDFGSTLGKFVDYVEHNGVIRDFVHSCYREGFSVAEEVLQVSENHGFIFDLGSTAEEEVFTVYSILRYIRENDIEIIRLIQSYSGSRKYRDMLAEFNRRVTLVLVNSIVSFLTKVVIQMGFDEEEKFVITANGGQVVIAKDQSRVSAVQNNGVHPDELEGLVDTVKQLLDESVPEDVKEQIQQGVETIQT